MFKIFKRRKDKPALTYSVMQKLGEIVDRRQRKLANYLNSKTKSFSKRKWLWMLAVFCIVFGTCAAGILCNSVMNKNKERYQIHPPKNISVPAFILQKEKGMDSLGILEQLYEHRNLIKHQKGAEWKSK